MLPDRNGIAASIGNLGEKICIHNKKYYSNEFILCSWDEIKAECFAGKAETVLNVQQFGPTSHKEVESLKTIQNKGFQLEQVDPPFESQTP